MPTTLLSSSPTSISAEVEDFLKKRHIITENNNRKIKKHDDAKSDDEKKKQEETITTIDNPDEYMIDIVDNDDCIIIDDSNDDDSSSQQNNHQQVKKNISLWFRTWGNKSNGIPVLFIHGGPGSCVEDYNNINSKFFDATKFYIVEIDQRGTGNSQPSVRDDYRNMKYYMNISISQMSHDFDLIRKYLNIDKWLVFGGSWGATLGLEYCITYPNHCLGLIIRGVFLNTKDEFDEIYSRESFVEKFVVDCETNNNNNNNDNSQLQLQRKRQQRLNEFDIFFELAAANNNKEAAAAAAAKSSSTTSATNNHDSSYYEDSPEQFVRLYESMIMEGNRDAIWRFFVFENNLMEDDPNDLLDPYNVPSSDTDYLFKQAVSQSFFEARLFLRGTFEEPINILERLSSMKNIPTWIVQGTGDEVCPDIYAKQLICELERNDIPHKSYFIDHGGHTATTGGMFAAVKACVGDFYNTQHHLV